jgi:hypothetical protein
MNDDDLLEGLFEVICCTFSSGATWFFLKLLQDPGPKMDSSTGSSRSPWTAPKNITRKTILKNVTKIYDGAIVNAQIPNIVDRDPCKMGKPRWCKASLILSLGLSTFDDMNA